MVPLAGAEPSRSRGGGYRRSRDVDGGCECCHSAVPSGLNRSGWSELGLEGSPESGEGGACWVGDGGQR